MCRATGHPLPRVTWRREDNDYILMRKPGSRELVKGKFIALNKKYTEIVRLIDQDYKLVFKDNL